jgi:uncharacterized protein YhaN
LRLAKLLPVDKCASLIGALVAAEQVMGRCAKARQQRGRLEVELQTFRRRYQQGLDEQAAASATLAAWQTKWRACLSSLKRPPEETPVALERAIELIGDAHRERRTLEDLDHRITGMNENIAGFEAQVADLVNAVAPDLIGDPVELTVEKAAAAA